MSTDCLFREDSYLKDCERDRGRHQPRRRHRARPHRVLRGLRRPAGRPRHADHASGVESPSRTWSTPIRARPRSRMCRRTACRRPSRSATRSRAAIDWPLRHARMRMHTALHLLSADAALSGDRRLGRRGREPARLRHSRGRPRQGRDHRKARRDDRGRCRGVEPLDHRRRARSQSRPGQDHVGEAADGHRPGAADRDRRPRPAALRRHPCALAPPRSAPCA